MANLCTNIKLATLRNGKLGSSVLLFIFIFSALNEVHAYKASECRASAWRKWVGKDFNEFKKRYNSQARYVCDKCPMTLDFNPSRLTVVFSEDNDKILTMDCN